MLDATTALLDADGYDGVSYDEVARRAGVHKTTVYRRWPSKPELVADAVGLLAEEQIPVPDTGSLRDDLLALGHAVAATNSSEAGRRRSRSIVAAAAHSDEMATALHEFMRRRIDLCAPVVSRAIARDELPADADANHVIEAAVGPIWFRLLLTGEPVDEEFVTAVATSAAHPRPA